MRHDDQPQLIQAVARPFGGAQDRRLVPLRWPHSQKLIGYYDLDSHVLVYYDSRGRVLDQVDLMQYRSEQPTDR